MLLSGEEFAFCKPLMRGSKLQSAKGYVKDFLLENAKKRLPLSQTRLNWPGLFMNSGKIPLYPCAAMFLDFLSRKGEIEHFPLISFREA